ncbi:MAG: CoF synthetase, partial [Alphaproteobacteria bacterium]
MPFYGLSEISRIAGEVPGAPGSYAFEPAYGLAELVAEDGRAIVTPGETGRVVGTGFISAAMPLLRYDSGDLAELEEAPSPRNGYRLRIRRIASHRSQEILLGRQGEPIGMAAINIHSPAYSAIRVFQFMQDSPGTAVLKIAPVAGAPQERIEAFVAEISRKLRDALTLDVEYTDDFTSNSRGKRPYIDQRIPEAQLRP